MITFEHVTKYYDRNVGLEDASVQIDRGDFVFLVGPSGAGKSTFIKLILKEINADSGSIVVDGKEVTALSNRQIPDLRRKIGTVFQDFRLLPRKTVYENVAFAMEILHKSKRQIRKKVPQVLSLVGISDKADQYPNELSAGEQQRVAIARAIINNPPVLIADEPTGNLDPDTADEIMDLLNQINMTGTTIVMVTHAKDIVDRMKKRVVAIEGGHIVRDEFGQYGYAEEENIVSGTEWTEALIEAMEGESTGFTTEPVYTAGIGETAEPGSVIEASEPETSEIEAPDISEPIEAEVGEEADGEIDEIVNEMIDEVVMEEIIDEIAEAEMPEPETEPAAIPDAEQETDAAQISDAAQESEEDEAEAWADDLMYDDETSKFNTRAFVIHGDTMTEAAEEVDADEQDKL